MTTTQNHRAPFALGRLKSGKMGKDEERYAAFLADRQHAGEVRWFKFEAIKLRLADGSWYIPDFLVMLADATLEVHEVKGHWQDDARVKIKVAQDLFPFRFIAVKTVPASRGGGWEVEDFEKADAPLLPGMRTKAEVPPPKKRLKPDDTPLASPAPLRRKTRRAPPPDTLL